MNKNILFSKNPYSEIISYLKAKKLYDFFHIIFSCQRCSKLEFARSHMTLLKGDGFYFGDNDDDQKCARYLGKRFIRIKHAHSNNSCSSWQ